MALRKEQRKKKGWTHLLPKLRELTISADTFNHYHFDYDTNSWREKILLGPDHISLDRRAPASFNTFNQLTHLHFYFANLNRKDNELLAFLLHLPKLTHLRLTRPPSAMRNTIYMEGNLGLYGGLGEAVKILLEDRSENAKLETVIVQIDKHSDEDIVAKLSEIQRLHQDRLFIINPDQYPEYEYQQQFTPGSAKECEELGFQQFTERASGCIGAWSKDCTSLWL